jgi:adenosylcobinamide kinase/adenosylcobinamide-phosphate guanylyltransferase
VAAEITLVLGGARSGKSEVAERLAHKVGPAVTYVATGAIRADDSEWDDRIRRHRERRPAGWTTLEVGLGGDLAAVLGACSGPALVDSLGAWVAGLPGFGDDGIAGSLCAALTSRRDAGQATIIVSDEVGMGVHPSTTAGRQFRDALGVVNREAAAVADSVLLVVAGRVLALGSVPP